MSEKSQAERYIEFQAGADSAPVAAEKTDAPAAASPPEVVDAPAPTDKAQQAPAAASSEAAELFPGYASLPDESRAAIDKMLAAERAQREAAESEARRWRNQNQPLQRQNAELQRELKNRSAQHALSHPPADKPATPAAMQSRLDRLRADLPDEVAAIEETIAATIDPLKKATEEQKQAFERRVEELEHRLARADAFAEMNRFDSSWESKIHSDEFNTWATALCDVNDECFDPVMADAIDRVRKGYDVGVLQSLLNQFDRDVAEANAARVASEPAAVTVRKPNPDPTPGRSAVATTAAPRVYASEQERRYAELKARLGIA